MEIVTTRSAITAANFGSDGIPNKDERYARAEEFVDVVLELWDSWEDDALIGDREQGIFADRSKIHTIDHVRRWFSVRGPLNVPRGPQGRPVLVQAGASAVERLASRFADAVFTAQTTLPEARAFYAEIKGDAAGSFGRDPDQIVILPGLFPIVGSTEREAWSAKSGLTPSSTSTQSCSSWPRSWASTPSCSSSTSPSPLTCWQPTVAGPRAASSRRRSTSRSARTSPYARSSTTTRVVTG